MLVSVSGLIGSGKDTIASYLVENHNFKQFSFASTLKDAIAPIFSWDRTMLEGSTPQDRAEREIVDQWWAKRLGIPHLTPRWVLQHFGTQVCREHFHNDIWIASLERKLAVYKDSNIVISDARFLNELGMLQQAGSISVSVTRGALPDWWDIAKVANYDITATKTMNSLGIHPTEWEWIGHDFDHRLTNDKTLPDLYSEVDDALFKNQE